MAQKIIADRDLIVEMLERIRATLGPASGIAMEDYDFFVKNCAQLHQYIMSCPSNDNQSSYPSLRVRRS